MHSSRIVAADASRKAPDHALIAAAAAIRQARTRTARAAAALDRAGAKHEPASNLVAAMRAPTAARGGSFHAGVAREG
ncbi:hypothetical protein [Sphingomonas sp.]|uniref:hypothetical protein n=1 Tax=Sphingomonas sp. TaxID=28214 RepID=UPI003AFFB3C1